ncbi:MAG: damage-inducible protein DinB [Treponema sp.]|nr:damage-inducible protein DinB [Treponema sp.]
MKEMVTMFAGYNKEANQALLGILNKMPGEDREKARGSYYKSLSGIVSHILGGTVYMLGMLKDAVGKNAAAQKALAALGKVTVPSGKLTADQWKKLAEDIKTADTACVKFVSALSEAELGAPVKTDWYGGKPATVPLYFMLGQLTAHGTHHRGQVSQILDKLKIDNDWSGINVKLLP